MTHKEDYSSEFDIYLSDILDRLREKYGYASVNRLSDKVVFYVYTKNNRVSLGIKFDTSILTTDNKPTTTLNAESITIPNSEIEDCMKNKTLPKEIQQLL